jgi:hypothetical protein
LGTGFTTLSVNGFDEDAINGRYTEDASPEKKMNGRSTMWNGNYFLFWCASSFVAISHSGNWDENAADTTKCEASGYTSGDNKDELLRAEFWMEHVNGKFQQNNGVDVVVSGEW